MNETRIPTATINNLLQGNYFQVEARMIDYEQSASG
jgi:hypothetical protein